nr:MAG TPA: hypothetical protein [Caudoviricetes sp.]
MPTFAHFCPKIGHGSFTVRLGVLPFFCPIPIFLFKNFI